jgi:hypothetical protein
MWRDAARYIASSHLYLLALFSEVAASLLAFARIAVERVLLLVLLLATIVPGLYAQSLTEVAFLGPSAVAFEPAANSPAPSSPSSAATTELSYIKPIPVLSVGMGFVTPIEDGSVHLHPLIAPVVLIPFGEHWLFESRATFESDLAQPPGTSAFRGVVQKEVDYSQLDYIFNSYVTVVVGRFITPFGVFNERLYPIWIRNLQSDPLILPIATGPSGAGTGGMLRGGFAIHPKVNVNYAAYFSTLSTVSPVDSSRCAGIRLGIYLPEHRLEFGGSFQHLLQDERSNAFGFHFAWQPPSMPMDLRAEYARSARGSGYWIESAYQPSHPPIWQTTLRRTQFVGRVQQFFTGELPSNALPNVNTRQVEAGVNYFLLDSLRAVSSFGRQFTSQGDINTWTVGLTYRFVLGLGPGEPVEGNN